MIPSSSFDSTAIKYWCFISYRHADNHDQDRQWATWLHEEIEHYDVPAELVGTTNQRGDIIPAKIYPVFRDEESLSAEAHLGAGIQEALDASKMLVVLCSPRAAESKYVAAEIIRFQETGKSDRIITAIIDGEPNDLDRECFPEPLRKFVHGDEIVDLNDGPLAADFRLPDGREGFTSVKAYKLALISKRHPRSRIKSQASVYQLRLQLMKLKILAGILDIPLEILRNRDQAYQSARAKKKATALIFVALLAVSMGTWVWISRREVLFLTSEKEKLSKIEVHNKAEVLNAQNRTNKTLGDLHQQQIRRREILALSLSRTIGQTQGSLGPPEVRALWDLATIDPKDDDVRILYLQHILDSGAAAGQFSNRDSEAGSALLGLRLKFRKEAFKILIAQLKMASDPAVTMATTELISQIGEEALSGTVALADRIVIETDPDVLPRLGTKLGFMAENLPADAAVGFATGLRERMASEKSIRLRAGLIVTLGCLRENLSTEVANRYATTLAEWMATEKKYNVLEGLGKALGGLGKKLPADAAVKGATALIDGMETEQHFLELAGLASGLGSLAEMLPADSAAKSATVLADWMGTENESNMLASLGRALGSYGKKLPAEAAVKGATALADRMVTAKDSLELARLGLALGGLEKKLPRDSAAKGATALAERIATEPDSAVLVKLGSALESLGKNLPTDASLKWATALAKRMENVTDSSVLAKRGSALGSFGEMLPTEAAVKAASALAKQMKNETDSSKLEDLGWALESLAKKLPANNAAIVASTLAERMATERDLEVRTTLGSILGKFGLKLQTSAAVMFTVELAKRMATETEDEVLACLRLALEDLGQKLPAEAAELFANELAAKMVIEKDSLVLAGLGSVLENLGAKLPPAAAVKGVKALAKQMITEKDFVKPEKLEKLGPPLVSLGDKLTKEDAVALVERMVSANFPDYLLNDALGLALAGLGKQLPTEAVVKLTKNLIVRVEAEKDSDQLASLGVALGDLEERLPTDTAAKVARALADKMERAGSSSDLASLGSALGSLGKKLPADLAVKGAAELAEAMEGQSDCRMLVKLASALGGLGENMPTEAAVKGAVALANQMTMETDSPSFVALGSALRGLGERMSVETAAKFAKTLTDQMATEKAFEVMTRLGMALGSLGEKLPIEYVDQAISAMLLDQPRDLEILAATARRLPESQDVVEVLKNPFCVGGARTRILDELGKRLSTADKKVEFHDLADVILRAEDFGLHIETPPKRPKWLKY